MPNTAIPAETIKGSINERYSASILLSTKVLSCKNTKHVEIQLTTKVVFIQNPTKVCIKIYWVHLPSDQK